MDFLTLTVIGTGATLLVKSLKNGKAAYDLGIQLESFRLVKWNTGYATLGVKFRLTNKNDTPVTLENYTVNIKYLNTELANGAGVLQHATVPAHGQAFVEFHINTANYTAGVLSLLTDLFKSNTTTKKVTVDYCIKVKGLPQYCGADEYTL